MKTSAFVFAAALGLATVPALAQTAPRPADTGSAAFPTPLPQGNVSTTVIGPQTPDTGNMAYPTPLPQGNVSNTMPTSRTPDTGNMAYPTPLPQGTVGSTTVK